MPDRNVPDRNVSDRNVSERNVSDRNGPERQGTGRRPAEGVRIIGAEEAQKALDEGQATGRRPEDELRYGDVPPTPSGPRPPHRFPLPDSVDPAEAVPRPPVAPIRQEPTVVGPGRTAPGQQPSEHDDVIVDLAEGSDDTDAYRSPDLASGSSDQDDAYAEDDEPVFDDDYGDIDLDVAAVPVDLSSTYGAQDRSTAGARDRPTDGARDRPNHDARADLRQTRSSLDAEAELAARAAGTAPSPSALHAARSESLRAAAPERQPWRPAADVAPDDPTGQLDLPPAGALVWADEAGASEPAEAGMHPRAEEGPYDPPGMASDPSDADPTTVTPVRRASAAEPPAPEPPAGEGRITVTGGHDLPHWTAPPGDLPEGLEREDEEMAAWNALGTGTARWRSEHDDWDDAGELDDLTGEGEPLGALDSYRDDDPSGMYSFDEDFERLEEERSASHGAVSFDDDDDDDDEIPEPEPPVERRPSGATRIATRARTVRQGTGAPRPTRPRPAARRSSELSSRVGIGVGLAVVFVIAYLVGSKALLVLAAAVLLACAVEAYGILRRSGFRPATLLGLVATVGFLFAAYWRGSEALPLVAALTFGATMVWYLLGIVDARPLANVAVTSMTVLWVGLFGSYAGLLLRAHHGRGLFFGAVAVTVLADVVAFLGGRSFGRRPMAPSVSPGKTIEGLVAGVVAALVVGIIVGKAISPWGGLKHGLLLGVVVAIAAPIGDLFESLIKRDLSVKDSGSSLGGHGGLLDRFDSLLLVLPATYYLADAFHLVH